MEAAVFLHVCISIQDSSQPW